ncbi:MAG: NapC/NirT family cytochrome c [candidate division Zixibacteria bacterium]|nr:NapC/NirT family cytochrome c [candidate division Zixibacteria bacterium]
MFTKYRNLIHGISINWCGKWGVILVTSSFISMVLLELARITGIITSSYVGLVTYMLFPVIFIVGLVLMPVGWFKLKKQTGKTFDEIVNSNFGKDDVSGGIWGSKLFRTVSLFTILNVLFLIVISSQMLMFMDSAEFCGTACHSVMNPEWVTYQQSPHARVKCVECHVGEGAGALIDSKLNGMWQMVSVTFDLLERPIPTPVHQLRPARETCEKCHWPAKFYGTRLKTIAHYAADETSTPSYSTLNMKIDCDNSMERAGIHWHVDADNEVRYQSADEKRKNILWAEVKRSDGSYHRYTNSNFQKDMSQAKDTEHDDVRSMDCVDCHNRATHIYEDPSNAIDRRMQRGLLDRSLPYVKREGLKAISTNYRDASAGLEGIANHMHGYYQRYNPEVARTKIGLIDSAVTVLQAIYSRNIHPEMNITWGTYRSNIGHVGNTGCFRCHNSNMVDEAGNSISQDCTLCHSILSYQQKNPFQILLPADTADPNYQMHLYLNQEFLQTLDEEAPDMGF